MSVVPPAQLSCQQCHQRKIKCSKTVPCSACLKAEINCTAVQRSRLPRGRSGRKRVGESKGIERSRLQDRLGNLEAVVANLQDRASRQGQASLTDARNLEDTPTETFIAPSFWNDLSEAVAGLRDVLELPDSDEEFHAPDAQSINPLQSTPTATVTTNSGLNGVLFPPLQSITTPDLVEVPSSLPDRLFDVYLDRVHSIFRPIHWHSTVSAIRSSPHVVEDRGFAPPHHAEVLERAIYFTAATSLLEHELQQKSSIVAHLRQRVEDAFIQINLLSTKSLLILQAFVIYLAGLRACQANAQQWTLTAVAVRLANAQDIPNCLAIRSSNTLHTEIKRRLWFSIGVLDLQSAFDRGSQPLLKSYDFGRLPLDVNDSDLYHVIASPIHDIPHNDFTESTLSNVIHRAGICQRRLNEIGAADLSSTSENSQVKATSTSLEQIKVLNQFEQLVTDLPTSCYGCPSLNHDFTLLVAKESLVSMKLLIHRPLYRVHGGFGTLDPELATFDVLKTAVEVLESSQAKRARPELLKWVWFSWVKWYALAIVLAELCIPRQSHLADRAWLVAQVCYDDYARIVADTREGLLWKPIAKLMRKARLIRHAIAFDFGSNANDQSVEGRAISDPDLEMGQPSFLDMHIYDTANAESLDESMLSAGGSSWIDWDALVCELNDPDAYSL